VRGEILSTTSGESQAYAKGNREWELEGEKIRMRKKTGRDKEKRKGMR
jgi:hypothetical protein